MQKDQIERGQKQKTEERQNQKGTVEGMVGKT
jgi:hypothetical protein